MELIADAKLGPKVVPVATARAPRSPRSKKAPREQKLDCGSLFGWWPDVASGIFALPSKPWQA